MSLGQIGSTGHRKLRRRFGIDEGGATEREEEQRPEKNKGCKVTIHDEVHERPQADAPEETGGA